MKKRILSLSIALATTLSYAQLLPLPSPLGNVTQVVGATEVSVEYSRPGVKDRKIFGELLPFDKIWRLGANASTKFTTSSELTFNDKQLKAGTYALFAIPKVDGTWEVAFNTDTEQRGTENYSAAKDVFRITAKVVENSFTETLFIGFDEVVETGGSLVILWENARVELPFTVNTMEVALKNIKEAIQKGEALDEVYYNAANYHFSSMQDTKTALDYVEKSIKLKESFRNLFLKARILETLGKKKKAIPLAKEALALAESAGSKGFANYISSTLENWEK